MRARRVVFLYLVAIVAANLAVSWLGPLASIPTSFLLIGLNLTARDYLHDAWQGQNLTRNMGLLIFSGSAISFAMGAGQIAVASFVAFAASETVDALMYHALCGRAKMFQVNGSNVVSAAVDSIIFPALAFGFPLLFGIMAGDFLAKVAGGFVWSLVLFRKA